MAIAVTFICIFFDFDPVKSFPLHLAARSVAKSLGKLVEANVKLVNSTSWIAGAVDAAMDRVKGGERAYLKEYGVHMVKRLLEAGLTPEETAWSQILPVASAMVPNQAQVVRIDYVLRSSRRRGISMTLFHTDCCIVHPNTGFLPRTSQCTSSQRTAPSCSPRHPRGGRSHSALSHGRYPYRRYLWLVSPVYR
jgi:hypothetical protein